MINENDSKKGREIIRKVIGYMTLGMDASPVFSEMCRASFTNDEVMKKMIYFYLTTYAEDNPDLAIMAGCLLEHRSAINEVESTKALIWLMGAFSAQLEEAPYRLEEYIDN
ncbi:unnamed protein product [Sphagnum balticum]